MAGASVPAPDARALRRARSVIRQGAATPQDVLYRAYVGVILAAMLGAPVFAGVASALADLAQAVGTDVVVWRARQILGALVVLCAAAPSWTGPLLTSDAELHYLIDGPFGPRRVTLARTWTVIAAALGVGLILAGLVAAGLRLPPAATATTIAGVLGPVALGALALLGTQTRLSRAARVGAVVVGAAIVGCAEVAVRAAWPVGAGMDVWVAVVAAGLGTAAVALVPALLDRASLATVERDIRARRLMRAGLVTGDARMLGQHQGARRRSFRSRTLAMSGRSVVRAAAVDVLTAARRPWSTLAALLASGVTGAAVATGWRPEVVLPVGILVVAVSAGVVGRALVNVLDSMGGGRLDPAPFGATVASHANVPLGALLVVLGAGAGVGSLIDEGGSPGLTRAIGLVLVLVAGSTTALVMAGSGGAPLWALNASQGPFGSAAALFTLLWLGRGLVPAVAVAALLGATSASVPLATGVVAALSLAAAAWHLSRLRRADDRARGSAPE